MVEPKARRTDPTGPVVFIVFSLAGASYIVLSKTLHVEAAYVTLIPVMLMIGYAVCIWQFRGLRLRSDQSGDNFYYMGFIFTLTSLAVTLIQFSDGANAAEIVRNFGVAVASTIAGIVLRIVFNLFRRDPIEVEHEARIDLADAAKRVRLELNNILFELSHFTRAQQQMLTETLDEYRQRAEKSAASLEALLASDVHVKAISSAREELETTTRLMAEINGVLSAIPMDVAGHARRRRSWLRRLVFWSSADRAR